ncbi:hypothetical protein SLS58_007725 [Diplodia intermedia]|uniref:NADP-dependent oxidoreductase domain-containing protein n=1 Tax=Diplodia intermedia TaxID=856260 RepID=A0ABR3TJG8_9PEZI
MARHEGMALAPFGALGQGKFKKEAGGGEAPAAAAGDARKLFVQADKYKQVFKALDKLAVEKGTLPTSIVSPVPPQPPLPETILSDTVQKALAYVMGKTPYVFPIVGGRKIEHLKANIEALDVVLSEAEMDEIDASAPFEHGFPMELMFEFHGAQKYNSRMTSKDVVLVKCASYLEEPEPIK